MSIDGNECEENFYSKGKAYWEGISADIDGMLGGLSYVNQIDYESSRTFLRNQFHKLRDENVNVEHLKVLDCGAGIGRVSKYVLSNYFHEIHLLEQCSNFLEESYKYLENISSMISHRYCQAIQDFEPLPNIKYDCIWNQWVIGHITDEDLKTFLDKKCSQILEPHGFIMIKDNIIAGDESYLNEDDSSFTRTHEAYLKVLNNLDNLKLDRVIKQKNMPKDLLPVRMYILSHKK